MVGRVILISLQSVYLAQFIPALVAVFGRLRQLKHCKLSSLLIRQATNARIGHYFEIVHCLQREGRSLWFKVFSTVLKRILAWNMRWLGSFRLRLLIKFGLQISNLCSELINERSLSKKLLFCPRRRINLHPLAIAYVIGLLVT